jgi:hypothetical protein
MQRSRGTTCLKGRFTSVPTKTLLEMERLLETSQLGYGCNRNTWNFSGPNSVGNYLQSSQSIETGYEKCHEYFDEVFSKEMFRSEELAIGVGYSFW